MSVLNRLLGTVSDDGSVVCECRHCGTSVNETAASCPECGTRDIVRYEI